MKSWEKDIIFGERYYFWITNKAVRYEGKIKPQKRTPDVGKG